MGISTSTGPPRPDRSCVNARRKMAGICLADVIGSADLVTLAMLRLAL